MKKRPFAYNPSRTPISGTLQVGDLAIGVEIQDYSTNIGGVKWWAGPDEDLGYVLGVPVNTLNMPTPIGNIGTVQFWRSLELTDVSFLSLINNLSGGLVTEISEIQDWIDNNEYWTSWENPSPVLFIDAGDSFYLALKENGEIRSFGVNYDGQLGDNTVISKYIPTKLSGNKKTFCHISAGASHSTSIDKYGQVWAWGKYNYGQLGIGETFDDKTTPISIHGNKKTFCQISGGSNHTIGIDKNGQIWTWGYNSYGELGDNTITTSRFTPVSIHGNKKTFCKINASTDTSLAIDYNGKIWAWGNNMWGKVGYYEYYYLTPIAVGHELNKTFCQITNSEFESIALDKNGQVWGWGYDKENYQVYSYIPYLINNKTFCYINGNSGNVFLIEHNGQVWGWGYGALGAGKKYLWFYKRTPISLYGNKTFCKITTGIDTFGIDHLNQIWQWGKGFNSIRSTPVSLYGDNKTFCQITPGMAIDKSGQVWGWGYNIYGNLGINTGFRDNYMYYGIIDIGAIIYTPVSILGNKKTFCEISLKWGNHTLSIDKNGQVWGWGYNSNGQLGDNSTSSRLTPVSILGTKKTFCKINSGGRYHSIGLDKNGQIWTWGYGYHGQLGNNEINNKLTPVSIHGNKKTFCQISTYNNTTMGIDKNGQIWGWGNNEDWMLGDNSNTNKCTPVSMHGNKKTFCKIHVGAGKGRISMAIDHTGQIWGWGYSIMDLGNNKNYIDVESTPVSIHGNRKTFCEISASVALDKYGKIWLWGQDTYKITNEYGEDNLTPVEIITNKTFCKIEQNYYTLQAVDNHGNLWVWGESEKIGINYNYNTPVKVTYL